MKNRNGIRILVMALSMAFLAGALLSSPANVKASWVFDWDNEVALGSPASQAVVVSNPAGLVYIMGGVRDVSYNAVADAYSYDTSNGAWNVLAPMLVAERGAAGAMGNNGRVYVFGGDVGPGYTQIYNPTTNSWSLGAAMLRGVWEGKAATVANGSIWVVGGEGAPSPGYAQIYNPATNSWSVGRPVPAEVLGGAMIAVGNDLYYSGGADTFYTGKTSFFKYDSSAGDWVALADLPQPLAGHAMVMGVDGLIYVIGGSSNAFNTGKGVTYSSVFAYDPAADEWSYVVNMDNSRTYLGAVVTPGGRLFALGGNTESTVLDVVESLQLYLFEYSVEVSATSVRAGGSLMMLLDSQFTYIDGYDSNAYWYIRSDDGTVYNPDSAWFRVDSPVGISVEIPEDLPAGEYTFVLAFWIIYADGVYEVVEMVEFPLQVLPAAPTTEELLAELAALKAQLNALNSSQSQEMAQLTQAITALQEQLAAMGQGMAAMDDRIDTLEDKADSANLWGMVTMMLVIVVIVLLALLFVMGRRKA